VDAFNTCYFYTEEKYAKSYGHEIISRKYTYGMLQYDDLRFV